jgi:hypothetical protein
MVKQFNPQLPGEYLLWFTLWEVSLASFVGRVQALGVEHGVQQALRLLSFPGTEMNGGGLD